MRKWIIACLCFFTVICSYAQVSDAAWKAVVNQKVIIEKNDGSEVIGRLASVDEQVAVVIKADGKVVSVVKKDVQSIRVDTAAEAAAQQQQQPSSAAASVPDVPLKPMYFLFDPLGFLQAGPVLEFGFRVAPETLLGAAVRLEGLGLLIRALNANTVSPLGMGVEVTFYQLLPGGGMNRWYLQALGGFGWGSTSGGSGAFAWQGNNTHLEIAVGGGYRWRFASRFFLDAGVVAGAAVGLTDTWYYLNSPSSINTNVPDTTFFGALQLHIGWELGT
jgi:small nuclear ribonucleoprotein (snRNP)-like protein